MADGDSGDFGLASIGTGELAAVTTELVGSMSGASLTVDVGSVAVGPVAASGTSGVTAAVTAEATVEVAVGPG
ncbi:MAG: hypothetical protein WBD25_16670 [Terriglobales bacterium]